MTESLRVETPFLDRLGALDWTAPSCRGPYATDTLT